jgi:glycosyltransferase involved in cell wall biosynthesis
MREIITVINLVDQLSAVNFGIWHAAIATSGFLLQNHQVHSILVAPDSDFEWDIQRFPFVDCLRISDLGKSSAISFFQKFNPKTSIVVSHGAWQFPSRWAFQAKKMGFSWVYTPHGMLEPWSMAQKKWKKALYFSLMEKRMASKADAIRAVGSPEASNLKKHFKKVSWIPNGIYPEDILENEKAGGTLHFLFLARLHHKKGVLPLLEAWSKSSLCKKDSFCLHIAGTPDGEEEKLKKYLKEIKPGNVLYHGPTFGEAKKALLKKCHFYVLPSLSEGFPTSVVEAMAAGLIPIISKGCNFPEVFSEKLGIEIEQEPGSIQTGLESVLKLENSQIETLSQKNRSFVADKYNWAEIARRQFELYSAL